MAVATRDRGDIVAAESAGGIALDMAERLTPSSQRRYGSYVLVLLTLAYALNFLDRQIVNILSESIKRDLKISDAQLGLLTGTAFGLFYSTLGIPIARLADRWHRVNVLSASLLIWSGFTVICGLATNFMQLFLARLGVGVGEAGGTPAAYSLISDYFPYERRSTAIAIVSMGLPLGTAAGFGMGGYLESLLGWRHSILVAGLPGILLALVVKLSLREPVRGTADTVNSPVVTPSFRASVAELLERKTFPRAAAGGACAVFLVYVSNAWLPAFFIRLHGMSVSQVGLWIALSVCTGGTVGVLFGGIVTDRLKARYAGSELWVPALATVLCMIALVGLLFARETSVAIACMFAMYAFGSIWMGPTSSIVQSVAPVHSRSLATGIQLFVGNMLSLTIGPFLVGFLSDRFGAFYGLEGLRYALLSVAGMGIVGAALYLSAMPYLQQDRARNAQ